MIGNCSAVHIGLEGGTECRLKSGHKGDHDGYMPMSGKRIGWPQRDSGGRLVPIPTTVDDAVDHPSHYTSDPSGVECITITRHRNFNVGNAFKYLWRAGLKDDPASSAREKHVEDLRKAIWYIEDEIARIERGASDG